LDRRQARGLQVEQVGIELGAHHEWDARQHEGDPSHGMNNRRELRGGALP